MSHALAFSSLFLIVLGARWWMIAHFGSPTPFLDQWNGEAASVYLPYLNGTFAWGDLLAPHNEHRIALTKLEGLLLLVANGQWDARLQMVVNAVIQAGAATALAAALWTLAGRRHLDAIALLVGIAFATPVAWENTLAGFQSQFYYLNLTAFVGLWVLPFARPMSTRWVCGLAVLALGLVSMATGFVAPIAAALVVTLYDAGAGRLGRGTAITAGAATAVAAIGLLLPSLPDEDPARAHSIAQVAEFAARGLAWPFVTHGWMAAVMWAPGVALALRAAYSRTCHAIDAYLCGLAAWVVALALGAAWARAGVGDVPSSRYMDFLAVGPVINGIAAVLMLDTSRSRTVRVPGHLAAFAWAACLVVGVEALSREAVLLAAPNRRAWTNAYDTNIRQLANDADLARFSRLQFPREVPWLDARALALDWLYDPALRAVLPSSIRDPLRVNGAGSTPFSAPGTYPTTPPLPGRLGLGSYAQQGDATVGRFQSEPLQCTARGWLRFDIAGYLGAPGISLALQPIDGGPTREVRMGQLAREQWKAAFARCPEGRFTIVATDTSATTWFAFGPPVEVGPLSRWAEQAANRGRMLLLLGLLLAAVAPRAARCG